MEIFAKGQLSFLILSCLVEKDYYGLEIIDRVKERSEGRIVLKKPSVYSSLTRMEKAGQVSSYVKSSEFGPNRKYMSLTEKGRQTYISMKEYYDKNGIDVYKEYVEDSPNLEVPQQVEEPAPVEEIEQQEEQSNDFFDFSSLDEEKQEEKPDDGVFITQRMTEEEMISQTQTQEEVQEIEKVEEITQESTQETVQEETTQEEAPQPIQEKEEEQATVEQDATLSNQQIYDISKDFNKYKRKRSFAEDQMAFAVEDSLARDDEKQRQNIADLKSALLESKQRNQTERMSEEEFYAARNHQTSSANLYGQTQSTIKETATQDDGVFITGQSTRITEPPKVHKIEPPIFKVLGEKEPLPAPNKDKTLDISHKEIISRLYQKTKGGENGGFASRDDAIYDYDDLQDYYKSQGIAFDIYEKTGFKEKHNTNKLAFYASLICMICSLVSSALLFTIFYLTGHLMAATNFLYILLPLLSIAETVWKFNSYKNHTSWEPKPMLPQILVWLFALLGCGAIIGLNFAFGMTGASFLDFSNTIFYPLVCVLIYIPMYYYIKKALLVKFYR